MDFWATVTGGPRSDSDKHNRSTRSAVSTTLWTVPVEELVRLLVLGLLAGALGGLVGVGGSIVIIPVLTLLLGKDQHLSQATAMIINVLVAAASLLQHHRAGAVQWVVVGRLVPFGLVLIVVGVLVSNTVEGEILMKLYGVFLLYVIAFSVMKLLDDHRSQTRQESPKTGWVRVGIVGGLMGFVAGLLGIGGAPVSIPMLQRINHLPLRQAIAVTSAAMVITSIVGAIGKNLTLSSLTDAAGRSLGLTVQDSFLLASFLAPTAVLGALAGARLAHILPVRWVRAAFILLMIWASIEMLGFV